MNYTNTFMQPARIRFVNQALQEGLNIFINDQQIIRGLNFQQTTQYIPLPCGMYNIKIYTMNNNLLLNENVNIFGSKLISIMQNQMGNFELRITDDMGMFQMPEVRDTQIAGRARVRFAHFSPNLPVVDITLPNGNVLFRNIGYNTITDYITIAPGSYNLQVRVAGTNQVIQMIPMFVLSANDTKTIYAIGLINGNPMLETIIVND